MLNATVLLIYGSYWMHLRLSESHSGNNEQSWSTELVFKVQKWSDECQGCWCWGPTSISKTYIDVARIIDHIHANRDITMCNVANGLETSSETCQSILKPDVNIWQTVIKFVPCVLSDKKKENHVHVCQVLQDKLQKGNSQLLQT